MIIIEKCNTHYVTISNFEINGGMAEITLRRKGAPDPVSKFFNAFAEPGETYSPRYENADWCVKRGPHCANGITARLAIRNFLRKVYASYAREAEKTFSDYCFDRQARDVPAYHCAAGTLDVTVAEPYRYVRSASLTARNGFEVHHSNRSCAIGDVFEQCADRDAARIVRESQDYRDLISKIAAEK
jgi:hypothetical protein